MITSWRLSDENVWTPVFGDQQAGTSAPTSAHGGFANPLAPAMSSGGAASQPTPFPAMGLPNPMAGIPSQYTSVQPRDYFAPMKAYQQFKSGADMSDAGIAPTVGGK